jgi:hypothetical protein
MASKLMTYAFTCNATTELTLCGSFRSDLFIVGSNGNVETWTNFRGRESGIVSFASYTLSSIIMMCF